MGGLVLEILYGDDVPGFFFLRRGRCSVFGCLLVTEASLAMEFKQTILNIENLNQELVRTDTCSSHHLFVCFSFFSRTAQTRSALLHNDRRTIRKYSIYFAMPETLQQCF